MSDGDRVLRYLFEHGQGWGQGRGVEPFRLEHSLARSREELAPTLHHLTSLGLIGCDVQATTPFNDPIGFEGVRLLNVYLTERGWEVARHLPEAAC
jgi:hypothetical protein